MDGQWNEPGKVEADFQTPVTILTRLWQVAEMAVVHSDPRETLFVDDSRSDAEDADDMRGVFEMDSKRCSCTERFRFPDTMLTMRERVRLRSA